MAGGQKITIFYNARESRWAFVTPENMVPTIDFGDYNKIISEAFLLLKNYSVGNALGSELHASLFSFSNFVKRGRIRLVLRGWVKCFLSG